LSVLSSRPFSADFEEILMLTPRHLAAFIGLVLAASPLAAADLTKIDRKIGKEPVYQSKPKYCLLVFGPEAKTRVWVVLDGQTLYVDRNGDGDLTESGERVVVKKEAAAQPGEGVTFEAGEIQEGTLRHKNLQVSVVPLTALAERDEQAKQQVAK